MVAKLLYISERKVGLLALDLLHAQHVWPVLLNVSFDVWESLADGIYIPSCNSEHLGTLR
jgi:hypothetical protein